MTDDEPRAGTRSRENTRARLLDAAAEVFAEVGLGEASVERICERAGFTRGAFYSNFASKDEMFLELAKAVARDRVAAVRARVAEIDAGDLDLDPANGAAIIRVLDVIGDDRVSTLLMNEISIRAMRDREFGAAYASQDDELFGEVVQIIEEISGAQGLVLRLPPPEAARIILGVWSDVSARGVIAGLDADEMAERRSVEVGRVVQLVVESR